MNIEANKPPPSCDKRLQQPLLPQPYPISPVSPSAHKPSKYRYCVLALFFLLAASNAYQWLQYGIIQNVVVEFYNVSSLAVDWTSMVYLVAFPPLVFCATWLLNRFGLRACVLTGATLNCMGAIVKCFSANRGRFAVALAGQSFCAVAQVFILNIPAQLAALWFDSRERSTACGIGVLGTQVGVALGFVVPPLLVRASNVENDLFWSFVYNAVATAAIFAAILVFFRQKTQVRNYTDEHISPSSKLPDQSYGHDLRQLAGNRNFVLLVLSFGLITGVYFSIGPRLNFVVMHYFGQGREEDSDAVQRQAGFIGLIMIIAGLFGSVLSGIVLDRTGKYKLTAIMLFFLSICATFAFVISLQMIREFWTLTLASFVTAGGLGFFMTGILPVGYEFGVELTYPVQEGTSSGMLNASSAVFAMIITVALGAVHESFSVFWGNMSMVAVLTVGLVLTLCVDGTVLKRTQAEMALKQEKQKVFN